MAMSLLAATLGAVGFTDTISSPAIQGPLPSAASQLPDKAIANPPETPEVRLAPAERVPDAIKPEALPEAAEIPAEEATLNYAWVTAPDRGDQNMYPAENWKVVNKWNSLGRETGSLGQAMSYLTCASGGSYCYEEFERGIVYTLSTHPYAYVMYRTPESKAWEQSNPNTVMYTQNPKQFTGPYGWPTSDSTCNGDTCVQQFEQVVIYSSRTTGSATVLMRNKAITTYYLNSGAHTGTMGYPAGSDACTGNGCVQKFQNGTLYAKTGTAVIPIMNSNPIVAKYAELGNEAGTLGYPVSAWNGSYQNFERGMIFVTPSGVIAIDGEIYKTYKANGINTGPLGMPLANKVCTANGCYQDFANGRIYGGVSNQIFLSNDSITKKYNELGDHVGALGFPLGSKVCKAEGCYWRFQNGLIHASSSGSIYVVEGATFTKYKSIGYPEVFGPSSYLGLPVSNATTVDGQTIQRFAGGTIGTDSTGTRDYRNSECDALTNGKSKYTHGNANRVTLAIAEGYGQYQASVINCKKVAGTYLLDWQTYGTVGQSGFKRPDEASGPTYNRYSPTGSYSITEAFGLQNPGTALPYKTLNQNSRWGGNPFSGYYNKYVEYSGPAQGYDENMWNFATMPGQDYRNGAVINYNRAPDSPIVENAGFAIFLHENPVPTAGCVAIDHVYMVRWLQTAQVNDRIIMGVRADLFHS